jgi:hypothetical protein
VFQVDPGLIFKASNSGLASGKFDRNIFGGGIAVCGWVEFAGCRNGLGDVFRSAALS